MRSWFLLLCLASCHPIWLMAQFEPHFTQQVYHRYLGNPAYAGSTSNVEFSLLHRSQYVGLSQTPIASQAFNVNAPIKKISSGVGLTLVNDFIGFQRATYVQAEYCYRKAFKWGQLSAGLGVGVIQVGLEGDKLRTPGGEYLNGPNHNDGILPSVQSSGIAPDFSAGIYINNNDYFAGVSLQHIAFTKATLSQTVNPAKVLFTRVLQVSGGYTFKAHKKLKVTPALHLYSDFVNVQTNFSTTFIIINNILTGVAFRGHSPKSVDAFSLMAGFTYKGLRLVYSYDIGVSYLRQFNGGSHEIGVSYSFPLKVKEVKGYFYHNPRYN